MGAPSKFTAQSSGFPRRPLQGSTEVDEQDARTNNTTPRVMNRHKTRVKRKKKTTAVQERDGKEMELTLPAIRRRIVRVTEGASCGKPLLSTEAIVT